MRDPAHPAIGDEIIGLSGEGWPLAVRCLGDHDAPLRVLIVAGQHGDEPGARQAVARLMEELAATPHDPLLRGLRLALLPSANPDGAARQARQNARGVDLNRDHQRLRSPETCALHRFVRAWQPHVVIDVHNYPPRRKHLLARNLVRHHDILLDVPTHPAIRSPLGETSVLRFFHVMQSGLRVCGFSADRYTLISRSWRVRHSTPDVTNARNALALKHDLLAILLEGRTPTRGKRKRGHQRAVAAQLQALRLILGWLEAHQDEVARNRRGLPAAGQVVAVHSRYRRASEPRLILFQHAGTGKLIETEFPKYTPHQQVTRTVALPVAYAVPAGKLRLLETLERHGFAWHLPDSSVSALVERYSISAATPSRRAHRAPRRLVVRPEQAHRSLGGYVLFPVQQEGGHALAIFLEAESKYGLHRYPEMDLPIQADMEYPILRVL